LSSEDSRECSGSPVSGEEYEPKPQFLDDKSCIQIRDEIYRIGDCVWLHRDHTYTPDIKRGENKSMVFAIIYSYCYRRVRGYVQI